MYAGEYNKHYNNFTFMFISITPVISLEVDGKDGVLGVAGEIEGVNWFITDGLFDEEAEATSFIATGFNDTKSDCNKLGCIRWKNIYTWFYYFDFMDKSSFHFQMNSKMIMLIFLIKWIKQHFKL